MKEGWAIQPPPHQSEWARGMGIWLAGGVLREASRILLLDIGSVQCVFSLLIPIYPGSTAREYSYCMAISLKSQELNDQFCPNF